ncbi:hypothetical protein ACHWQZ_G002784 [Mnemiopsis leidyi]
MIKNLMKWIALAHLLLTTSSASPYPNCTDPSTYTSYGKSTEYKGLSDSTAWDRSTNSGDGCNLSSVSSITQTCGDCDFDLEDDIWYRFDLGPYVKIAELSQNFSCPLRGHCNGFYQLALLSSDIGSGNVNSKIYHLVFSNPSDDAKCSVSSNQFMIEEFFCDKFRLYKFPSGWKNSSAACRYEYKNNLTLYTPFSLCMTDTNKELTMTANRKYFTESNTTLTCTSVMSPKPPPKMLWYDDSYQGITSKAIRDSTPSSLFTEVHSIISSSLTSATCQVNNKSYTFYRVSIETRNVTGIAGEEVTMTCNFTLDEISYENKEDLYFIEIANDFEVFYNPLNISYRGDTLKIEKVDTGIYSVSLRNIRTKSEEWLCGVRDPITNEFITVPLTISITKSCDAGKGFLSDNSVECVTCHENTYSNSSQNHCEDCPIGQVSGKGASRCFEIIAKVKADSSSRLLNAICLVILPRFSVEIEDNFYMIQRKECEDVYFTKRNVTSGYEIDILKSGTGTYNITLAIRDTSVPDNTRTRTEKWSCGVRDPTTGIYTTTPFTVTFNKHCKLGTGFATPEATVCTKCPENTFSSNDKCKECEDEKTSDAGSEKCWKKSNPWNQFIVVAGVGGVVLVILYCLCRRS